MILITKIKIFTKYIHNLCPTIIRYLHMILWCNYHVVNCKITSLSVIGFWHCLLCVNMCICYIFLLVKLCRYIFYMCNICTLSDNINLICTFSRNRWKSEFFLSVSQRVKLFENYYRQCTYILVLQYIIVQLRFLVVSIFLE